MEINRAGVHWAIVFFCLLIPQGALAETRYVSDVLVVTVRSSAGENFETLETLKTNEAVQVLEDTGAYTRVTTPSGAEGWILSQYLTKETPKPVVITRLEREKARLEAQLKEIGASEGKLKAELAQIKGVHRETLSDIEGKYSRAQSEATETSQELASLKEKYNQLVEQSRDVVALIQERDGLRTANEGLTTEVEFLRQENERLSRTGGIRWFLAGAAVLFFGWLVGRASRKKKKYY